MHPRVEQMRVYSDTNCVSPGILLDHQLIEWDFVAGMLLSHEKLIWTATKQFEDSTWRAVIQ